MMGKTATPPTPETIQKPADPPKKPANPKRGWITLESDRGFGSITGSEFRVWGGK